VSLNPNQSGVILYAVLMFWSWNSDEIHVLH